MVIQYHELECHAEKMFAILQGEGHRDVSYDQYIIVSSTYIFRTAHSSATKLGLILNHKPVSYKKTGLLHSKSGYSEASKCQYLTKLYRLVVYYHKPACLMKKLDCCAQDHSEDSKCQ